jgi:hypothetical protein
MASDDDDLQLAQHTLDYLGLGTQTPPFPPPPPGIMTSSIGSDRMSMLLGVREPSNVPMEPPKTMQEDVARSTTGSASLYADTDEVGLDELEMVPESIPGAAAFPDATAHSPVAATRALWIGNLDPNLTQDEVWQAFAPFGQIESVRILPDRECAFVNYVKANDALEAYKQMQGGHLGDCIMEIGFGRTVRASDIFLVLF